MINNNKMNIPNALTFSRIVMIPVIIAASFYDTTFSKYLILLIFIYCSFTDFLDGYLARKLNQTSLIGKLMDPIADKLLTTCILLILIHQEVIYGYMIIAVILIISREIFISGLREFLAQTNIHLPVSNVAKLKTFFQFFSMGTILFGNAFAFQFVTEIGFIFLWIAAIFTIVSGFFYFIEGIKSFPNK